MTSLTSDDKQLTSDDKQLTTDEVKDWSNWDAEVDRSISDVIVVINDVTASVWTAAVTVYQ